MGTTTSVRTVAALAGRRIDPDDAIAPRFPISRVRIVRDAITGLLVRECVSTLVCSAACGADLVALEAAWSLGLRCRVVLPFAQDEFRRSSVIDRPGDWGHVYDRLLSRIRAAGDLVILDGPVGDARAYREANEAIVSQTNSLASDRRRLAILVWEGHAHDETDLTAEFRRLACAAGMEQREVMTCDSD
jgi:hypothetical protein